MRQDVIPLGHDGLCDASRRNRSEPDDKMIPKDAFILPDDPMVYDPFRDALISPDEPFEPRGEEGGVVVGMDGSPEHEAAGSVALLLGPDQVAAALEAVSADLKENGINGLHVGPGTSAFERTLRKYLMKYFSDYD